jgi:hypothetical protein
VDSSFLIVARGSDTQVNLTERHELFSGKEIAAVELSAKDDERIDLVGLVAPIDQAFPSSSTSVEAAHDNVAYASGELALHPQKPRVEIENEVVAFVVQRPRDSDAELRAFEDNGRFGNQS